MQRSVTPPITGWQRIWIVLAMTVLLPAVGKVELDWLRWAAYAVLWFIILAAMGVVELAMALWYRARRRGA
jgi:hypothetical protein